VSVFVDPLALVAGDPVHTERSLIIGESVRQRLLLTVFVERAEDEIRLISARRATNRERRTMRADRKRRKARKQREPSKASLREIPEVDFSTARRSPYAARIAKEGIVVQVGRGRPKRILEVGGTSPRSVRVRSGSRTPSGSRSRPVRGQSV